MDDPWADTAGDIGASTSPPRTSTDSHALSSHSHHTDPRASSDSARRVASSRVSGDGGLGDEWRASAELRRVVSEAESAFASGPSAPSSPVAKDVPVLPSSPPTVADTQPPSKVDDADAVTQTGPMYPSDAELATDASVEEPQPTAPAQLEDSIPQDDDFPSPAEDVEEPDAGDFDDFDDFDAPQAASFDDDGFGDFGDFAEGQEEPEPVAVREVVEERQQWTALSLRPVPVRRELQERLEAVLAPLVPSAEGFNDDPPRAVGGLAQVLTSESSRGAYAQLTTAPILKPLDWTRSRVRREHLIAMGVPVNLDEVDSHRLTALPPLQIRTGMGSSRNSHDKRRHTPSHSRKNSTSASAPVSSVVREPPTDKYGLGTRPEFDVPTAERLCALEDDQLTLMSVDKLKRIQDELVGTTADASAQLAWLLQLKDALGHDSATYNGMISELIANAAKAKQPSSGMWSGRKSRPSSMSATHTPRRTGSPSVF